MIISQYAGGMTIEANQEDIFYVSFDLPVIGDKILFAAVHSSKDAVVFRSPIFMEYLSQLPHKIFKRLSKHLDGQGVLWLHKNDDAIIKLIDESLDFLHRNLSLIFYSKIMQKANTVEKEVNIISG